VFIFRTHSREVTHPALSTLEGSENISEELFAYFLSITQFI